MANDPAAPSEWARGQAREVMAEVVSRCDTPAETVLARALDAARAEAEAVARESNSQCVCGCAWEDHDNYGEEGIGCADPMHECLTCSTAVKVYIDTLRAERDAARAEEREACAKVAHEFCESAYEAGNREAEDTAERIEAALRARGEEANRG